MSNEAGTLRLYKVDTYQTLSKIGKRSIDSSVSIFLDGVGNHNAFRPQVCTLKDATTSREMPRWLAILSLVERAAVADSYRPSVDSSHSVIRKIFTASARKR